MSFDAPEIPKPILPEAPKPPVLASSPQGTKPKKKSTAPSVIGTGLNDPGSGMAQNTFGGKSLLGGAM